jgi:hypothetical protein
VKHTKTDALPDRRADRSRWHGVLGCLTGLLLAASAGAQEFPVGTRSCGSAGGAVVIAKVVDDSTRVPIGGSRVHLIAPICNGVTDSVGRFVFTDVRPGAQIFDAGHIDYREFGRFRAEADAGDTLEVELRLRRGGPIADCRALPTCAPLLADVPIEGMSEAERFQLLTLGTTVALAWQRRFADQGSLYACIEGAPSSVLDALRTRYAKTVDAGQCVTPGMFRSGSDRVRHIPTDSLAFLVRATLFREERAAAGREMSLQFITAGRGGEGWLCGFERASGTWRLTRCLHTIQF